MKEKRDYVIKYIKRFGGMMALLLVKILIVFLVDTGVTGLAFGITTT
jgi:hypothetical protein